MTTGLLFSHPTGNANVRAALAGLLEAGLLGEFHTSIAAYPGNLWDRLSRTQPGREFQRRAFDARLRPLTVQHPWRELGRLAASRLKLSRLTRHETGPFSIDAIYQAQDRAVARRLRLAASARGGGATPPGSLLAARLRPVGSQPEGARRFSGVYAYEDGALNSFLAAQSLKLACFYDLPIGYWRTARKLLEGEFDRMPEWSATLTGFKDSSAKLERKDAELAAASHIFVASSFTAKTLADYPGPIAPVSVIPYGFPPVDQELRAASSEQRPRRLAEGRPLRLLFVGGLSQRKGIADLFAAVNRLGDHVSLTIIGGKVGTECPALDRELARHRWIPSLPHAKILEEMRAHDVFVFPSLFEGFGLVITETMSQGTPVITTERTAGPDLITHGENGWLIPAGNTEALVQQLEELIRNPELVRAAGQAALRTAAARPWSVYGKELAEAVAKP
jgi:glycosyltransferase involved in cell wall biosynthesis